MPAQTQIEAPTEWEDVAGIGPTRAAELRAELGDYSEWNSNSKTFKKNSIAKTHSGNRRNQPQYAQNAIDAGNPRRRSPENVDSDLVNEREVDRRSARSRSKTKQKQRVEDRDRSDRGFELMDRGATDVAATFGALQTQYDDRFDVPAAELGRTIRDEEDPATSQPVISAASSRVTFAGGAQPADLVDETERAVSNTGGSQAVISPGEALDKLGDFVEEKFGFEREQGGVTFDSRDRVAAEELNEERSAKARRVDSRRDAPVTGDLSKWATNPDEYDYPGVDTGPGFEGGGGLLGDDPATGLEQITERIGGSSDEADLGMRDSVADTLDDLDQSPNSGRY